MMRVREGSGGDLVNSRYDFGAVAQEKYNCVKKDKKNRTLGIRFN